MEIASARQLRPNCLFQPQEEQKICTSQSRSSWVSAIVDNTNNTQSWTISQIPFAFVNATEQQK